MRRLVQPLLGSLWLLALTSSPLHAQSSSSAAAPASAGTAAADSRTWLENVNVFAGLDGSKQPQDLGINANMGVRLAANAGIPLVKSARLGAQVGVALNLSDAAVHVLEQVEGTSRRTQTFATIGLFQQATDRLSWALAYDFLHQKYFDAFTLGQLRGEAGFDVTTTDEVGAWFTKSAKGDSGTMGTTPVRLDPISQINTYLKHRWPSSAETTAWVGVAAGHNNIVFLLPNDSRTRRVLVYGARLDLPLSDRVSITGSSNFLTPAATGTVDAYLGVTIHAARRRAPRSTFAPPVSVANNPEFAVDLHR